MCTAALSATQDGGFVLADNRDENRARKRAKPPARHVRDGVAFLAPTDRDAGGTWIAVNARGLGLCLLNYYQASLTHFPDTPIVSRGEVIHALISASTLAEARARLQGGAVALAQTRPFVLLMVQPRATADDHAPEAALLHGGSMGAPRAWRACWSGRKLDLAPWSLPAVEVSHIQYDAALTARAASAAPMLEPGAADALSSQAVRDLFAAHAPRKGRMSICMHSPISKTVSHTQIEARPTGISMTYYAGSPCQPAAVERVAMEGWAA